MEPDFKHDGKMENVQRFFDRIGTCPPRIENFDEYVVKGILQICSIWLICNDMSPQQILSSVFRSAKKGDMIGV